MSVPLLIVVAWGALAFGAVYDWAYGGLLAACVILALRGLLKRVPHARRRVNLPVLAGLVIVCAAISVQLIPLDRATLVSLSPATDDFLRQYNIEYATRVVFEIATEARSNTAEARSKKQEGITPHEAGPTPHVPRPTSQAPIRHPLSIDPDKTVVGLVFVAVFGVFVLGLARGLGGRDLRVFAPGLVALGVLMSLVGIIQKALWNGKVYGLWTPENIGAGAFGPFINRNHFAGWMLLALPFVAAYFAAQVARGMVGVRPGWRNRVMWFSTPDASRAVMTGFSLLVMGLALAMTLSRSGISCFLLAITISGVHVLRHQATTTKQRLLSGYLIVVFVAAVSWAGIDAIGERFAQVDWELGGRAGAWSDAWRIHQLFPVFGTGFNTYGTATLLHQRFQVKDAHYVEAHNDYLQLLTEGGYLVAVPALLLVALFVWQVRARFREGHDDRTGYWLRLGAVTGIVAMAFQEIVEFSLQMPGNFVLFATLCAIAIRKATPKTGTGTGTGAGTGTEARSKKQEGTRSTKHDERSHTGTQRRRSQTRHHMMIIAAAAMAAGAAACGGGDEGEAAKPAVEATYSKTTGKLELLTYDTNRDKKPDAWSHMDGTRLVRMDIDRNFDGIVDRWEYYTPDGAIEKVGFSRANNGTVDAWAYQDAAGQLARIEVSTRRDGKVSRWELYEKGVLARAEEDSDGDGRVDKWEQYANGALASVSIDSQKRGRPDRKLIYGADGVRVERIRD